MMIFVTNGLSRHGFLRTGTAAGGGLLLSLSLPLGHRAAEATGAGDCAPNAFIRIGNDGQIVLTMPNAGMTRAAYAAMSMLIAEELEVAPGRIRLEYTPANDRTTGGPARTSLMPLRQVGAIARTMLVNAAAKRWNVDPAACQARSGEVIHAVSGRRAGYGELATYAGRLPAPETVALHRPAEWNNAGRPAWRRDAAARVIGAGVFGIDPRRAVVKIATLA